MDDTQATRLREPFRPAQIGHFQRSGVTLDFVGHAATTDRLLQVDPEWTWTPVAHDEQGLPRRDEHGGLWINLTVAGVTRLGYGDAGTKTGPNAVKEAIGDAIRNAAMRFGVALDLWAKEDLQADESADKSPRGASRSPDRASTPAAPTAPATPPADEHVLSTNDLKLPPEARKVITAAQRKKLFALARGYNMSDTTLRTIVEAVTGSRSTAEIKRGTQFDLLLERVELEGRGAEA